MSKSQNAILVEWRGILKEIYVNLKRFDVPKSYGGICPEENPVKWIQDVIEKTVQLKLGLIEGVQVVYFLPEALLVSALDKLHSISKEKVGNFQIGCQGVYSEDVALGKNFGAFTTNRPAAAMKALGETWVMIGHSEERKDKLSLIKAYDSSIDIDTNAYAAAVSSVEKVLNEEVRCALKQGMNVLFCVGETAEQKGYDIPEKYEPRVREVLKAQLCEGLSGIREFLKDCKISIGYEPIWAIGPGKIPPNGSYVAFVSECIKAVCKEEFGVELPVVYGGGLKEENAAEMASVDSLDGGLVALTKFTDPIGFDVASLKKIIEAYVN